MGPIRNAYTLNAGKTEAKTILEICNVDGRRNVVLKFVV
jgi:hypothetical protein